LGAGRTLHLQVSGKGGVPTSGVGAVVLNVTVTGPTAQSFLTVWPSLTNRPTASSLNFAAGFTGANSVTVPLGTNGQVDIFNCVGHGAGDAGGPGFHPPHDGAIPRRWTHGWPVPADRCEPLHRHPGRPDRPRGQPPRAVVGAHHPSHAARLPGLLDQHAPP